MLFTFFIRPPFFVCMILTHYLKVKDGNVLGDLASGASNLAGKVSQKYCYRVYDS